MFMHKITTHMVSVNGKHPGEVLSYFKEFTLAVFCWRFANLPIPKLWNHRNIHSIVTKQYITYIAYQNLIKNSYQPKWP